MYEEQFIHVSYFKWDQMNIRNADESCNNEIKCLLLPEFLLNEHKHDETNCT